jgi:hypothetical protein
MTTPKPLSLQEQNAMLRDALEDERNWLEIQRKAISKGCGSSWDMMQCSERIALIDVAMTADASDQARDAGPWRYGTHPDNPLFALRYYLESDDSTHDVRLYINGDFADDAQRKQYGEALAASLNAARPALVGAEPVRYEIRMLGPTGQKGPWDATGAEVFAKFSAAPDIGDGFTYETRALFVCDAAPAAPTDYEALEREHLGDFDKRTGIYAPAAPVVEAKPNLSISASNFDTSPEPVDSVKVQAKPEPVEHAPLAYVLDFVPEAPDGPAEESLTPDEFALYSAMSDISEERWFAGWMGGNEYELWSAMQDGEIGDFNRNTLAYIAAMSVKTGKWIVWHSDADASLSGPRAVSLFDWMAIYEAKNDMRAGSSAGAVDGESGK